MLGVSLDIFLKMFKYEENKIQNYEMPISDHVMLDL